MNAFFCETGHQYDRFNYLGEWHSHPRFPVTPSAQDVESMVDLVNGERGIDFAVLLIVRLQWWRKISGWSEVAMYFPGIPPSATFKLAK